jgi:hypothetical protein
VQSTIYSIAIVWLKAETMLTSCGTSTRGITTLFKAEKTFIKDTHAGTMPMMLKPVIAVGTTIKTGM